jgi:hypothetical protein
VGKKIQLPVRVVDDTVRVSVVVEDDRGFTHCYEDVVTTPAALREAFHLMVRRAPTVGGRSAAS